jgi:hypothetical protein
VKDLVPEAAQVMDVDPVIEHAIMLAKHIPLGKWIYLPWVTIIVTPNDLYCQRGQKKRVQKQGNRGNRLALKLLS